MGRPIVAPDFATDAAFAAGSDPWSAYPNKVSPGALIGSGFIPGTFMASEHMNYMLHNHGAWLAYLDSLQNDYFRIDDDFTSPFVDATADGDLVGKHWHLEASSNLTVKDQALISPGDPLWFGAIAFTQTGSATSSGSLVTVNLRVPPTDIMWKCRARITTLLDLNFTGGFLLGSDGYGPVGFVADGSGSGVWDYFDESGAGHVTTVPIVDGEWVEFMATCIAGVVTYYIDGVQVATRNTDTSVFAGLAGPSVFVTGRNISAGTYFMEVDRIYYAASRV